MHDNLIPSTPPLALALGRLRPRGTTANPRAWPFAARLSETPAQGEPRAEPPDNDFLILNPAPSLTQESGSPRSHQIRLELEQPLFADSHNRGTYWFDL